MGLEKITADRVRRAALEIASLRATAEEHNGNLKSDEEPIAWTPGPFDQAIELSAVQTDEGAVLRLPRQIADRVNELAPPTVEESESDEARQRVEKALQQLAKQVPSEDLEKLSSEELADLSAHTEDAGEQPANSERGGRRRKPRNK